MPGVAVTQFRDFFPSNSVGGGRHRLDLDQLDLPDSQREMRESTDREALASIMS